MMKLAMLKLDPEWTQRGWVYDRNGIANTPHKARIVRSVNWESYDGPEWQVQVRGEVVAHCDTLLEALRIAEATAQLAGEDAS